MNVDTFFAHHRIKENPFDAEEARLDPIFDRLRDAKMTHPDFGKILGRVDQPATAIVFGEKGSGKTAIRLLMSQAIDRHNTDNPAKRVLALSYDDLNPLLDRLLQRRKQKVDAVLRDFRLEDHQDALLSLAVTRLIDALQDAGREAAHENPIRLPDDADKRLKKMPRQKRRDLAMLAAVYDAPETGSAGERFARLRSRLRLGWQLPGRLFRDLAGVLLVVAGLLGVAKLIMDAPDEPFWLVPAIAAALAAAVLSAGYWVWNGYWTWSLARRVRQEMPAIGRSVGELRTMLASLPRAELTRQPLPLPGKSEQALRDSRYQLTRRFIDVLLELDYVGVIVMVDRVDEPTAVSGEPQRMRAIIWPMFDNKFLKQDRVGLKLLLPIELRHLLSKEGPEFYQEARLDKQNMIDRLEWSGTTLYDLCNSRLRACRGDQGAEVRKQEAGDDAAEAGASGGTASQGAASGGGSIVLADLFAEDVTREALVDALDQMHQPRDAFKFVYAVIQEHCRMTGEDQPVFQIPRLTLETVRRTQSQRVQDFHRGLSPA